MFRIEWRNRNKSLIVIQGIGSYSTEEKAIAQIEIFKSIFPFNTYYLISP